MPKRRQKGSGGLYRRMMGKAATVPGPVCEVCGAADLKPAYYYGARMVECPRGHAYVPEESRAEA